VIATGLSPDSHREQVELAIAAARERPDRVLVITDRLDFAPLLRVGAGFEHVPAAGERQAELADGSYADFRARRIALIRARRPRPRRVLELDPRV
jgi:hypothetical protein